MRVYQIVKTSKGEAKLYKGFTQGDIPSTYKKLGVLSHNIGNNYNSSTLVLYKAKDKTLRYEIYRDGNIYPYYGKFEYITNEV